MDCNVPIKYRAPCPAALAQEEANVILSETADNISACALSGAVDAVRSSEKIQRILQTAIERTKQ